MILSCRLLYMLAVVGCVWHYACGDESVSPPFGIAKRIPWTNSKMVGSPDPPLPYVTSPALAGIQWDRPIYAKQEPHSDQLLVIQQGGESDRHAKLLLVKDRPDVTETQLLLEIPKRLVYGMEFHPDYPKNGYIYLFSNGPTGSPERQNRISRFTVSGLDGRRKCDLDSEQVVIEWKSMGHDGGDLVFGQDGMLYITSGDGTSDSDQWLSAQDPSNLLGGVLRIDIRNAKSGQAYTIPSDNPFVDVPGARGELWVIGLRNPWRMSIDSRTGHIWVGNNGQDLWETAHLLGRGENYGWSVYEGSHPFYPRRELGPGKLTPPTLEHHHRKARSLTGGVVYHGQKFPDLVGCYIYGDYGTGKIWAARHDGTRLESNWEIADTPFQIVGFSNSHRGELLIIDHLTGLHRLVVNPRMSDADDLPVFPKKLSSTGLYASVSDHRMAPGVIPFSVNAPAWNDGAMVERFLAVPGELEIGYTSDRGWNFPEGSVLVQTLTMPHAIDENSNVARRRIETRILLRQQGEWAGYSYRWNEEQTDADLVGSDGANLSLRVAKRAANLGSIERSGGTETQMWRIPSRSECMSCHSRAVNFVLGMTEAQMNRSHRYGDIEDNQIRTLNHIGIFALKQEGPYESRRRLVNPYDSSRDSGADLQARAKSYLAVNCSGCHVEAGGGNARMELSYSRSLDQMRIVSQYPQHDTFGIAQPQIVAPGEPERSVLLRRVSRRGRGQMPPLGTNSVDTDAVDLLRTWIESMKPDRPFVREWSKGNLAAFAEINPDRTDELGKQAFSKAGCAQCHGIGGTRGGGIGPDLTDLGGRQKLSQVIDSIVNPSAIIDKKYASTVITTVDGTIFQGRVESDDEDSLVLRGTDSFASPVTIPKASIDQRSLSTVSTMPVGTLNCLEEQEVRALLAYLMGQ